MKKLSVLVLTLIFPLVTLLTVSAQEATFEDKTLKELIKNSAQWKENKKIRIVVVSEEFADEGKTSVSYSKQTIEVLPPDRSRNVYETRTARGIEREEYLTVGKQRFVRSGDGAWEIFAPTIGEGMGNGSGTGSGDRPTVETGIARTLTKNVAVGGQTADLYKVVTTTRYTYATRAYTILETDSHWFDSRGRIVKEVEEQQNGNTKTLSRRTEDYEYDPKLKIETPVIGKKNKPRK